MDDSNTVALMTIFTSVLGLAALLGVFLAFAGFAQARNPQGPFTWSKRQRTEWLHDWIPALRWAAPEQQADVFNQTTRLLGWIQVGMGLGLFVGSATTVAIITALPLFPRNADWSNSLTTFIIPQLYLLIMVLPVALGAALAFRLAARAAHRARPTTDFPAWQSRRGRDYLAAWLWWMFVAVMCGVAIVGVASTLYAAQHPPLYAPPLSSAIEIALLGLSAATLLAPLLFWLTSSWILTAPPAITTPYSGITDHAEDYVRAQALVHSQSFLMRCVAFLLLALAISPSTSFAFGDSPWLWALPSFFALAFALLITSSLLQLFRGRLGGRRTGWPWAPRRQRAPATA